ncbi:MAG TPA: DoxX family protein [Ktedonobacterales bacterium]|nr:DoxX family protein [Ktedonobacterales bacterium]
MNISLWIVQVLLALAFLLAGVPKATQPIPALAKRITWANDVPEPLVRLIGVAEILGALGLILPALTGILPWLTVAAAIGLAVVMAAAIIFHILRGETNRIAMNVILLALLLFVVYGRLALTPLA